MEYLLVPRVPSTMSLRRSWPSVLTSTPSPGMVDGPDSGLTAAEWNGRQKVVKMIMEKPEIYVNIITEHHHLSLALMVS